MQQFKTATIFGSSLLDFSPVWEKSIWGGRCRREGREIEITLSPFPPFVLFAPHSPLFEINEWLKGEDAAVEEPSLLGFPVEMSDFHENEQDTFP